MIEIIEPEVIKSVLVIITNYDELILNEADDERQKNVIHYSKVVKETFGSNIQSKFIALPLLQDALDELKEEYEDDYKEILNQRRQIFELMKNVSAYQLQRFIKLIKEKMTKMDAFLKQIISKPSEYISTNKSEELYIYLRIEITLLENGLAKSTPVGLGDEVNGFIFRQFGSMKQLKKDPKLEEAKLEDLSRSIMNPYDRMRALLSMKLKDLLITSARILKENENRIELKIMLKEDKNELFKNITFYDLFAPREIFFDTRNDRELIFTWPAASKVLENNLYVENVAMGLRIPEIDAIKLQKAWINKNKV